MTAKAPDRHKKVLQYVRITVKERKMAEQMAADHDRSVAYTLGRIITVGLRHISPSDLSKPGQRED